MAAVCVIRPLAAMLSGLRKLQKWPCARVGLSDRVELGVTANHLVALPDSPLTSVR